MEALSSTIYDTIPPCNHLKLISQLITFLFLFALFSFSHHAFCFSFTTSPSLQSRYHPQQLVHSKTRPPIRHNNCKGFKLQSISVSAKFIPQIQANIRWNVKTHHHRSKNWFVIFHLQNRLIILQWIVYIGTQRCMLQYNWSPFLWALVYYRVPFLRLSWVRMLHLCLRRRRQVERIVKAH